MNDSMLCLVLKSGAASSAKCNQGQRPSGLVSVPCRRRLSRGTWVGDNARARSPLDRAPGLVVAFVDCAMRKIDGDCVGGDPMTSRVALWRGAGSEGRIMASGLAQPRPAIPIGFHCPTTMVGSHRAIGGADG